MPAPMVRANAPRGGRMMSFASHIGPPEETDEGPYDAKCIGCGALFMAGVTLDCIRRFGPWHCNKCDTWSELPAE